MEDIFVVDHHPSSIESHVARSMKRPASEVLYAYTLLQQPLIMDVMQVGPSAILDLDGICVVDLFFRHPIGWVASQTSGGEGNLKATPATRRSLFIELCIGANQLAAPLSRPRPFNGATTALPNFQNAATADSVRVFWGFFFVLID